MKAMNRKNRINLIFCITICVAFLSTTLICNLYAPYTNAIILTNSNADLKGVSEFQKPQAATSYSIVNVTDNMGNARDYTSQFKLETKQTFYISAKWNETIDSINITMQQSNSINFDSVSDYLGLYKNPDPGCEGTNFSNFTLTTEDVMESTYKRFRISVRLTLTDIYITTEWQNYTISPGANPITSIGAVLVGVNIMHNSKSAIQLSYQQCFIDNGVGIRAYQIARSEVKITSQNFVSNIIGESTTTSYIDTSSDGSDPKFYFYGVRAVDYANYNSSIVSIEKSVSFDRILPTISELNFMYNGKQVSAELQFTPQGTLKIQFSVDETCIQGNITLTNQAGGVAPYIFNLVVPSSGNVWSHSIDLAKPRSVVGNIQPGIYDLTVIMVDRNNNIKTETFTAIFTIIPFEPEDNNLTQLIAIILVAVGVAGVGLFILIKRKRNSEAAGDASDLEISRGPSKAKKKGKIYKGASSIGKASGIEAENLQKRRGIVESDNSAAKPSAVKKTSLSNESNSIRKNTSNIIAEPTSSIKKSKGIESNVDDLLMDSKPSTMQLKQAESHVDLSRKMGFLTSKLDALDQNFALMNIILEQSSTIELPKKKCELCNNTIPLSWEKCGFCAIDQKKSQLSDKMGNLKVIGQQIMCPKCRKILQPNWNKCPYCLN